MILIRFTIFAQQTHSSARVRRMKNQDGEVQKALELVPVNVRSSVKGHSIIGTNSFLCFFNCCTVYFDNTEILITNKCTPLLHK
jgi:hypothetical protein